jgi:hypothetical protein
MINEIGIQLLLKIMELKKYLIKNLVKRKSGGLVKFIKQNVIP